MKKYITIIFALLTSVVYSQAPTLGARNSILGLYSGTYWDFYHGAPVVNAGCKVIALPNDTSGIIIHDTLNNLIDTLYINLWYNLDGTIADTELVRPINDPFGDVVPARDSISYGRMTPDNFPNASAYSQLTCVQHVFPTAIKEIPIIKVNLYPNPINDILNLTFEKNIARSYAIYNSMGCLIKQENIESNTQHKINLAELPSGIYYIRIQSLLGETTKRFIKN